MEGMALTAQSKSTEEAVRASHERSSIMTLYNRTSLRSPTSALARRPRSCPRQAHRSGDEVGGDMRQG